VNPIFEQLKTAEDVVAVFEDLNGDGHLDLYVGSGGNEYASGEVFNFDRIYLNDGKGNLRFSINSLPPIGENTSTVAVQDVNGDGYPDLFIGASVVTGNYGAIPKAFLLLNDGQGRFKDATDQYFGEEFRPGMVQKAIWEDINGDGKNELLIAGEWMPVKVFAQNGTGKYEERVDLADSGWHYGLRRFEIGGEKTGLLLGSLGLNSKLKASSEEPVVLLHGDFDGNGQDDPLIFHYMKGNLVPFSSRDDLIKQISALKRKHETYVSYSEIRSPGGLLDKDQLAQARTFMAKEFRSGLIVQKEGKPDFIPFPVETQFAPIKDFVSFETKGHVYVLAIGNFMGFRNDIGKAMAQPMVLLRWEEGGFVSVPLGIKGSEYFGELRNVEKIKVNGRDFILIVRNNDTPIFFEIMKN
jgi:enediyne biosynthesis protein E4